MWFGNMVTNDWWDDTWLNEGFSRFLEYFSYEKLYSQDSIWTYYFVKVI